MIVKNSLVYLSVNLLNKGVPFLLLPLLTNYLSPAEYGLVALFQVLITLYQSVFGLSLNIHVTRIYFRVRSERFSVYFGAVYLILFFSLFVSFLISVFLSSNINEYVGVGEGWIFVVPLISAMSMSNLIYLTLLRTKEKVYHYAAWELSATAFNLIVSILLVVLYEMGWGGRALGISIPFFLFGILGIVRLLKEGGISLSFFYEDVKEILSISIPLIPHAISMIVISSSDKFFVKYYEGSDAVGVYAVGFQFGMVVMLLADSCIKAWQPWFFKEMNSESRERRDSIYKFELLYLGGLLVAAILYSLVVVQIMPYVVGDEFNESKDIVLLISLGYFMFGIYQVYFLYIVFSGETRSMVLVTPFCALINVMSNIVLIPELGMYGAALSSFLAYSLLGLIVYFKAVAIRRRYGNA